MSNHYLIFEQGAGGGHAVVYFVRGPNVAQAIIKYLLDQNVGLVLHGDGTVTADGIDYSHSLAFIEANYKPYGEWQIRAIPDWTLQTQVAEVFCGESSDGPQEVINACRGELLKQFPRSRAKAFVWYLKEGTLVTFFRKKVSFRIEVIKRYLWNWDGVEETVAEWTGDYEQIVTNLIL